MPLKPRPPQQAKQKPALMLLPPIDGRTSEGRHITATRRRLTAHVGGHPDEAQKHLIELIASTKLRITVLDRRFVQPGPLSRTDARDYAAASILLARCLKDLGPAAVTTTPAPPEVLSLAAHRASRATAMPQPQPQPEPQRIPKS